MRKKKKSMWLIATLAIGSLALVVFCFFKFEISQYSYQESNAYFDNPDRGIYVQVFTDDADDMEEYAELEDRDNIRLILLSFELTGYENKDYIAEGKLNELRDALDVAKDNHFSVIFRSAYSFDSDYTDPDYIDLVCNHVEQICEVLNSYEDVIVCIQAGMLGPYGEWHSSKYIDLKYTNDAHKVLMTWLNHTKNISVALRRPSFVREAIERGADAERLTIHNDALLSTYNDMGTYDNKDYTRQEELVYIGNCTSAYMGGEMTGISDYTDIQLAVEEFIEMKIGYLNRYYNEAVWDLWKDQMYEEESADEYLLKHLGYRLSLESVTWKDFCFFKQLEIRIKNTGFGKLDSRYQFYLIIEEEEITNLIELKQSEKGFYYTPITYDFDSEKEYKLGLLISRTGVEDINNDNCIQLANDDIKYDNGINYFLKLKSALKREAHLGKKFVKMIE